LDEKHGGESASRYFVGDVAFAVFYTDALQPLRKLSITEVPAFQFGPEYA
jgi:hypothetical protein